MLSTVWRHLDCATASFGNIAKSPQAYPLHPRGTFPADSALPWTPLFNPRPTALPGRLPRSIRCNPDSTTPPKSAWMGRCAPSPPRCSGGGRLGSVERPHQGGVARSSPCLRGWPAWAGRLARPRSGKTAQGGRAGVRRHAPPHAALSVDRGETELVTAEVAREICNPAPPNNFLPSLDTKQSSGGGGSAREARLPLGKDSRLTCSRATRAVRAEGGAQHLYRRMQVYRQHVRIWRKMLPSSSSCSSGSEKWVRLRNSDGWRLQVVK